VDKSLRVAIGSVRVISGRSSRNNSSSSGSSSSCRSRTN